MPGVRKSSTQLAPAFPFPDPDALTLLLVSPPDALQQVKRSIRNLFSRKRKNQNQQKPAEDSTSSTPAPTVTAAGEPTQTETAPSPQPSTAVSPPESKVPTKSSQSQVSASPKGAADVNQKPETLPSTAQTLTLDTVPSPGRAGEPGMSATSGPLDDQMVHEYSDVGTDEAPAPVAKKAEVAKAATAVEGTALKA